MTYKAPDWHAPTCEAWELIEVHDGGDTCRLAQLGGWLYRVREWAPGAGRITVALTFIPDQWAK